MNLTQFESQIRPEVPGCPDAVIWDAIVHACRQFAEDSGLLRDSLSVTSVAGTQNYTLTPSSASNEVFAIYAVRTTSRVLTPLAEAPENRLTRSGTNSAYYTYNGGQLQILPTPEDAVAYTVEAMVRPIYQTSTTVDDRFGAYVDLISHWAKFKLMSMSAQPWTDVQGALFNKQRYDSLSSDAKWYGWRANTRATISVAQRPFA